ncbi:epithelial cell-transforming sequence 2 oncogene-like isoform X2 [Esox lucius]|uniref:epithelial cell-transforming sequence 2 oncogene-like isoform X2 n=1 Tax=Esox lucius TaxID=8010 RepID=UPI00147753C1|nr:epithelial cell-transforming sequence 2 oncogene-like isoform X2 [Esox lucius]
MHHQPSAEGTANTLYSAWTPINNRTSNQQLFEERVNLVLHWFDLWTDRQRKHFLQMLLSRCANSQLRSCRDWLTQAVPMTNVDFTSVLPRFLSLYVMSFLNPRDLCSAAQVSWHWRVLAEQDCLWSARCVRRGWFLPYRPGDKEYGGWKGHYVSCVSTLDWLTPREAAHTYGTLNLPCPGEREEEEERRRERRIRWSVRERLEEQKRASLRSRPPWRRPGGTVVNRAQGGKQVPGGQRSTRSSTGLSDRTRHLCLSSDDLTPVVSLKLTPALTLDKTHVRSQVTVRPRAPHPSSETPPLLLLLSNRISAYELVLSGVKAGVLVVLYDHRGTLQALLSQAERALGGQRAERLGVLAPGGTEEITLLQGCKVTERSVLSPDLRDFWEKLCGWVIPPEEGGGLDIFCPLAASGGWIDPTRTQIINANWQHYLTCPPCLSHPVSARGVLLLHCLQTLTGLEVWAPTGMSSGCFQNILSEWSCSEGGGARVRVLGACRAPAQRYLCEEVLQGWAWQAQWLEEALGFLRTRLGPQLPQLSLDTRGRALGQFLCEALAVEQLILSKELTEALTEGLTALAAEQTTRPVEFLCLFLKRWKEGRNVSNGGEERGREEGGEGEVIGERSPAPVFLTERGIPGIPQEWRCAVAIELYNSEKVYVKRLEAVRRVYHDPLLSALQSNRAIISSAHVDMILTPVTYILDINRVFLSELGSRLHQWAADQCVGDVWVKFCSKLRQYTNYLQNYPTAIRTIDKCREMNPAFRAFLKRHDRTLDTHMLSLQELLLCPAWRVEEYVTLVQALSLHTLAQHPDHTHLTAALDSLTRHRDFIRKLKRNSEKDMRMQEVQRMIQGCPNLCEGNRQLITNQDAALLKCPSDDITVSLRVYEHVSDVGLFLFNDALVLTQKRVCHLPFTHSRCDTHTFLASVSLHSLTVREITDTRYVSNGFVLEGPSRRWVCAVERQDDRERFLGALRSAVHASITDT